MTKTSSRWSSCLHFFIYVHALTLLLHDRSNTHAIGGVRCFLLGPSLCHCPVIGTDPLPPKRAVIIAEDTTKNMLIREHYYVVHVNRQVVHVEEVRFRKQTENFGHPSEETLNLHTLSCIPVVDISLLFVVDDGRWLAEADASKWSLFASQKTAVIKHCPVTVINGKCEQWKQQLV